jgi:hypothetical protein
VDAKNYAEPIKKGPVLDVSHYLKRHDCGLFALLATRAGAAPSAQHAIREHWIAEQKMILVLNDADLKRMLALREDGADPAIVIRERLRNLGFPGRFSLDAWRRPAAARMPPHGCRCRVAMRSVSGRSDLAVGRGRRFGCSSRRKAGAEAVDPGSW